MLRRRIRQDSQLTPVRVDCVYENISLQPNNVYAVKSGWQLRVYVWSRARPGPLLKPHGSTKSINNELYGRGTYQELSSMPGFTSRPY